MRTAAAAARATSRGWRTARSSCRTPTPTQQLLLQKAEALAKRCYGVVSRVEKAKPRTGMANALRWLVSREEEVEDAEEAEAVKAKLSAQKKQRPPGGSSSAVLNAGSGHAANYASYAANYAATVTDASTEESGPSPFAISRDPQHSQGLRSPAKHHRDRGMPSKEGCGCWPTHGSFGWLLSVEDLHHRIDE